MGLVVCPVGVGHCTVAVGVRKLQEMSFFATLVPHRGALLGETDLDGHRSVHLDCLSLDLAASLEVSHADVVLSGLESDGG